MKIEVVRAQFSEEDIKLFAAMLDMFWTDTTSYHLARCKLRAEAGYGKDRKLWDSFLAARAFKRLTK